MDLPEKILIVGLGKTGVSVAKFLWRKHRKITITDIKPEGALASAISELKGIEYKGVFGMHRMEDFLENDLIILSPGVDTELPYIKEARRNGKKVIGEIELASIYVNEPIIAITGTNGKTTVTTLIGEIFRRHFKDVYVGGNIGNPLIDYVSSEIKAKYVIVEISSFQLETIQNFHPFISVLLNITEDHLDRYRSFDEYRAAKLAIFKNQTEKNFAVINKKIELDVTIKPKRFFFSSDEPVDEGAFYSNGYMYIRVNGREFVYKREISPLVGDHNTENLLAILTVAHIVGVEKEAIEEVLKGFKGLPHRVEFVREINGITFINDSKATNVDATKRAIEGLKDGVILIAGGKDKGGSYKEILTVMKKIKGLILMGEAKDRIEKEIGGYTTVYRVNDLKEAVLKAYDIADRGDTVLFSPMCSSFDMFRDYKERGNTFKNLVGSL